MHGSSSELRVLIFVLLICSAWSKVLNSHCPYYCQCYTWKNMRAANCVGQNIVTVDIGVPSRTEALDVSNNLITRVEDNVFKRQELNSLKYLNLSYNYIKYIEMNGFSGLSNLQVLDLSQNHLHYLFVKTFDVLGKLTALYLSGNKFSKWTIKLQLESLLVLDLSNCNIESISPNAFTNVANLEVLSLENNQISVLKKDVLQSLHHLEIFNISGNPLICDEETNNLQTWLNFQMIKYRPMCQSKVKENKIEVKDKFGRILSSVEDFSDQTFVDVRSYWTIQDTDSTPELNNIQICKNSTVKRTSFFPNVQFFDKIPSFWSFIIGLLSGIAISIALILLTKIKCCQFSLPQRSQRRLSQMSEFEHLRRDSVCLWDSSGLETPPPPYRAVVSNYVTSQ